MVGRVVVERLGAAGGIAAHGPLELLQVHRRRQHRRDGDQRLQALARLHRQELDTIL